MRRQPRSSKKQPDMSSLGKPGALSRLCTIVALVGYLLAGASLVLPAESRCTRCDKPGMTATMKPGTSCPLSYNGHDCHGAQGKTAGHITLCPDGCLHHDGQTGVIPSLAKFLSTLDARLSGLFPVGFLARETPSPILDLPLSPPDHPPPARS